MRVQFRDLEDPDNPRNGQRTESGAEVLAWLDGMRSRPPFLAELAGDHGFRLDVGIGGDVGCVQHSRSDGLPPYMMALNPEVPRTEAIEFLAGGTPTPIDGRFCLSFPIIKAIVGDFVQSGERSSCVEWEEI